MCPRCRQNAPLVYRGVSAFCTACGAPRMPLANSSVTLAGQPSKVGGTVARVFGWIVLAAGWIVAALLAGLIMMLGGDTAALIVGSPIALIATIAAYALLRGGKELHKSGASEELATKNQAIFALANARGGVLRAWDVAQALGISPQEGDDVLTKLAKESPDHVTVDVDDEGNVLFRFPAVHWGRVPGMAGGGPTIAPNAVPSHVRVGGAPPQARVASAPEPVRVDPREPLEAELAEAEATRHQKAR